MTENSVDDLHYGHYGEVTYDPQTKVWLSRRASRALPALSSLGHSELYVNAPIAPPPEPLNRYSASYAKRQHIRKLTSSFPEFQPAASLLSNFLPDPTASLPISAEDQYKIGDLLAFGNARGSDARSGFRRVLVHRILAIPGGETGNGVRIFEMRPMRQGWGNDKAIWLETFNLKESEAAWWEGDGSCVRQITFAQGVEDDTTLLAVRSSQHITVLRPLYMREPVSRSRLRYSQASALSRIDPNPLITLSMPPLGDAECVDVAFNPWYQQQFGAINSEGCWIVWTLQGKAIVQAETFGGEMHGRFLDEEEEHDEGQQDGWHRILWVGNANTFVVCSRRRLEAFEIKGHTSSSPGTDFLAAHSPVWVLDIRKSPFGGDDLIVTTTTHILWLRYQRLGNIRNSRGSSFSFENVLAWRHHRDVQDSSLQTSFRSKAKGFSVVLFSQQTSIITDYHFALSGSDLQYSVSVSDPSHPEIDPDTLGTLVASRGRSGICNLAFMSTTYSERPFDVGYTALGNQYRRAGHHFSQLFCLTRDFSLTGQLCYSRDTVHNTGQRLTTSSKLHVVAPTWKRVRKRYKPRTRDIIVEDFIISDGDAVDSGLDEMTLRPLIYSSQRHSLKPHRSNSEDHVDEIAAWSVQNELVYAQLCNIVDTNSDGQRGSVADLVDLITDAAKITSSLQTLGSFSEALPRTLDIQNDAEALDAILETSPRATNSEGMTQLSIAVLASPAVLHLDRIGLGRLSLASIYRRLGNYYLNTLPLQVSAIVRSEKQALIKQVAISVCLASIGLRRVDEEQQSPGDLRPLADHHTSTDKRQNSIAGLSQPIPITSSQTFEGNLTQVPLSSSTVLPGFQNHANDDIAATVARLQAYTTIARPPKRGSKFKSAILSHWSLGSDPSLYNWQATSAALSGTVLIEGSAMSAADRDRVQRRLDRRRERAGERPSKRPRLDPRLVESGLTDQSVVGVSRALPERFALSQGGQRRSLSPEQMRLAVASQVEAGRFGGRLALGRLASRGRQVRKAGF